MNSIITFFLLALVPALDQSGLIDSLEYELGMWESISDDQEFSVAEVSSSLNDTSFNDIVPLPAFSLTGNRSDPLAVFIAAYSKHPVFIKPASHPATWRGGAESTTVRGIATKGNWHGTVTVDKDAYEPDWLDLQRYSLAYGKEEAKVIFGDFTLSTGLGVGFWNQPVFGTTSSYLNQVERTTFRMSEATNTLVNNALRGVGGTIVVNNLRLFSAVSLTRYDAIREDDGRVTRVSDGGFHRSAGEAEKEGTLEEQLLLIGGSHTVQMGELAITSGLVLWRSRYSPELAPDTTVADPVPLAGENAGALSLQLGTDYKKIRGSVEAARDHLGNWAKALRIAAPLLSEQTRVKLAFNHFPVDYVNPHAAPVGGRDPQGVTTIGVAVSHRLHSQACDQIIFSAVNFDDKIPAVGDALAKQRQDYSIEAEGKMLGSPSRLRLLYRHESISDPDMNPEQSLRVRVLHRPFASRSFDLSHWFEIARQVKELGDLSTGWATGFTVNGTLFGYGTSGNKSGKTRSSLQLRCGANYFNSENLPIYLGEISYPITSRIVRMEGCGLRIMSELTLRSEDNFGVSIKGMRTHPFRSGTTGNGELYLAFTLKN